MAAFSPLVPPGTALQIISPSAKAPAGRFANDPLFWVQVPAGTALKAFATGVVTAVVSVPSPAFAAALNATCTLIELSPLPQAAASVFKSLSGGVPLQLVLVPGSISGLNHDDLKKVGDTLVTPTTAAFFAVAFQDRVCRDPLSWAEQLQGTGGGDASWDAFVTSLAALPNARDLYVLDPVGRPLTSGTVSISIDGAARTNVTFTSTSDGNTHVNVPAASTATVSFTSASFPIVAAVGSDNGQLAMSLTLQKGSRLAQVLNADDWFAQRDFGATLPRWYGNCNVEPVVDGNPYFARLVTDLRKAKGGGAVELAGWAFVKGSLADSTIEWPLIPGADQAPNDTRLLSLTKELLNNGASVKFLVNQFLQFDSQTIDDFPELSAILFALYAGLAPLQLLKSNLVTDPAGYCVLAVAVPAVSTFFASPLAEDVLKTIFEFSKDFMDDAAKISPDLATWTPYPARFADNPFSPQPFAILGLPVDDISHIGVYHQKYVAIQTSAKEYIVWMGGIDINSDRVDSPLHRALHPFHDVQACLTGPAVVDVLNTFSERAAHANTTAPISPPASVHDAGNHLVQIGRTYFRPSPANAGNAFPSAPNGESTTVNTLMKAIRAARDYIYIEEQYFTPPDDYVQALLDAADNGVSALFISVAFKTDQPFGAIRQNAIKEALANKWKDRLHFGTLLRRYLHEIPALTANLGRLWLAQPLGSAAIDTKGVFAPAVHFPVPPFWCFIGNELVFVQGPIPGSDPTTRTASLIRGAGNATRTAHDAGTPVLCVQIPGIYVHAKVMMIDDVFVGIGSSNLNRRGLYHDGEIYCFTVPQHLKADAKNPARLLRCRLWAEHLGLSPEMGLSLLADPLSSLKYFQARSWFTNRRWQDYSFFSGTNPPVLTIDAAASIPMAILNLAMSAAKVALLKPEIWPTLTDPTTGLEPGPRKSGPEYP